jgi:hypothetical protein
MRYGFNLTFAVLILLATVLLQTACGAKSDSKSSGSGGGGGGGSPIAPPTVDEETPLALQIYTKYDGTEAVEYHTFSETGTEVCEATEANPVVTCTITVPEGQLHFSSTTLQYSRMPSKCKLMIFQPYSYLLSDTNAALLPSWGTTPFDCTGLPTPADCYGGAAKSIISTFPLDSALLFTPDLNKMDTPTSAESTVASAWERKVDSNRHVANDFAVASRGASIANLGNGDAYQAPNFSDYVWTCRDDWWDPQSFQITLIISDEDSEVNPQVNHFFSWKEY